MALREEFSCGDGERREHFTGNAEDVLRMIAAHPGDRVRASFEIFGENARRLAEIALRRDQNPELAYQATELAVQWARMLEAAGGPVLTESCLAASHGLTPLQGLSLARMDGSPLLRQAARDYAKLVDAQTRARETSTLRESQAAAESLKTEIPALDAAIARLSAELQADTTIADARALLHTLATETLAHGAEATKTKLRAKPALLRIAPQQTRNPFDIAGFVADNLTEADEAGAHAGHRWFEAGGRGPEAVFRIAELIERKARLLARAGEERAAAEALLGYCHILRREAIAVLESDAAS